DFVAKADGLVKASAALDASTVEGVQAGMGGLGGACKDCHTKYRL
ncbi:MAG: cytochrome c, partial [Rhodoferax sp.]|nr:cytochrome c [Pseudorhodobacter sp.]